MPPLDNEWESTSQHVYTAPGIARDAQPSPGGGDNSPRNDPPEKLRDSPSPRSGRYLDHLGFTLIALFDGFAIIAVLTAGGPGWLAAAVGVAGVAAGHVTIRRLKARLALAPE
ncbi:MAG: hypothetical protein ACR2KG_02490 [Nocardioidaceae bacterium]